MVALVLDGLVGFAAGLSPTSFHLSPSSFHVSPRLGACGRVRGWLVSHFFSFVSQFFSFVSQAGCLWSGSRPACLPLLFICLPVLFICLSGWVLVVGFPAGLSPTSFHLSPSSFHLSPRLGACGRVPGRLVSHFFSQFFPPRLGASGRVPGWLVSHFLSFVSQAGCLWSGSRLACLPLLFICLPVLFICLPGWALVVGFICLPLLFICLSGWVWWGSRLACLPLLFICPPGCLLLICLWSGSRLACLPLPFILNACARVPGPLVSHFLECVSHFFSFVSQAGCLWSGSGLACLPLPCICFPFPFICLPRLLSPISVTANFCPFLLAMQHFYSCPRSVTAGVRPSISILLSCRSVTGVSLCIGHEAFLFICLPCPSLLVPCSIHLFPRSITAAVRPFPLAM